MTPRRRQPSRWVLDLSVRRTPDGEVLSGGDPPRVMRLSERGASVLDRALAGTAPSRRAERALIERLVDRGLIHPLPGAEALPEGGVTFVIPAHDAAPWIGDLVSGLVRTAPTIVVDDASSDRTAETARRAGARVLANSFARGPGGARNTGLAAVDTEFVAFIDSDCIADAAWVGELAGLFADPRLALAAPRVRSAGGRSAIERYELRCSPLDLGPHPASVAPGKRLSYVPSAAALARVDALRAIGGFDESLSHGEDVDLAWRLTQAGWAVRYSPPAVVAHRPRSSLRGFCRQRVQYGRSAAALELRHPGAARPLHVSPTTLGLWLVALAAPRAGAVGVIAAIAPAGIGFPDGELRRHAWRLAGRGIGAATVQLARALTREWLPATALLSLRSRRLRRIAILAGTLDALVAWRAPAATATAGAGFLPLRILDRTAYMLGCWQGVIAHRSLAAVLPRRYRRARDHGISP